MREALGLVLDFEWVNRNLFPASSARTGSYFDESELSARGVPADERERALLAPFPDAVRPDILEGRMAPSRRTGPGATASRAPRARASRRGGLGPATTTA